MENAGGAKKERDLIPDPSTKSAGGETGDRKVA